MFRVHTPIIVEYINKITLLHTTLFHEEDTWSDNPQIKISFVKFVITKYFDGMNVYHCV